MPEKPDANINDILARQQFDLDRLKEAFGLLGITACSRCKKFYRRTDPGALFDAGELVCYGCIHQWWPQRSLQLSTKDRENLEAKLVFWLRDYHQAETFKDPAKLPDPSVTNCTLLPTAWNATEQESHWARTTAAFAKIAAPSG